MATMHILHNQALPDDPAQSASIEGLMDLRDRIDTGHRHAEIIEGRLVVSPIPVIWHERVCIWLDDQIRDASRAKGWLIDRAGEIFLAPTSDLIEPDVMVLSHAGDLPDLEHRRPLDCVLLVAEVISRSSIREDREVKPRACALAGVPLYLLVDRFTSPLTVSLHSEPGPDGYAKVEAVHAGGKVHVPAPFDLTLDTSGVPLPR